ncbi:MAG TPA: glycosyltransferase family A protein [Pyrinomonadaceae bacterium]|nr:glycosyltransferase family A protein [Pyrinomonadaceae bacterium]
MNDTNLPALSVVIVAPKIFGRIRKTIRALKAQTIKDLLEVIVVVPSADSVGVDESELSGFFRHQVIEVGPIHSVDRAAARTVKHATATVVAIIEDHAYPNPEWAEAIVAAHQNSWAAVGPSVENANPATMLSWTNLLMAYGKWGGATAGAVVDDLPKHNVSYKRAALMEFGDEIENMVGRDGSLHQNLRAKGHKFFMEPAAEIHHLNPSRLSSTITLRFQAGRMFGATRARGEKWSPLRRLLYIGALPLIPAMHLPRILREMRASGRDRELMPRVLPALFFGLALEAVGEVVGYAFGVGGASRFLETFELDRLDHLTAGDKRQAQV